MLKTLFLASNLIISGSWAMPTHYSINAQTKSNEHAYSDEFKERLSTFYSKRSNEFYVFFAKLKDDIIKDNAMEIGGTIRYPIMAYVGNKRIAIQTKKQFERHYTGIFNAKYKATVLENIDDLHILSHGVMIGDGKMWMNLDSKNNKWVIIAINN